MFYLLSKVSWLVVAPTTALILITAAASLWSAIRSSKWAAQLAAIGACGLLVAGFTPLGTWLTVPLEIRFPRWQAGAQAAPDGIIVLGGDAGDRLMTLLELSRRFSRARLVYSGPGSAEKGAEVLSRFARLGGDPARLTMEFRSRNTYENAKFSSDLIKPDPLERWLLITSASHMPRAVGCFRLAGFKVEPYPVDYSVADRSAFLAPFAVGSEALSMVDVASREWLGLLAYRLTGKTEVLFPAPQPLPKSSEGLKPQS
jgi:uncharacterized SAM-binding protein YcdF (DUF218 family)